MTAANVKQNNAIGSGRMENLDALKAISIILVVFCHYVLLSKESLAGNIVMSVAWSAVPCFMMVSGALMHNSKEFIWKKYFKKLAKIIAGFIIWRLIYLVVMAAFTEIDFTWSQLIQYLFFLKDMDQVNTSVMWYIVAYIAMLLMYPATFHLFKDEKGRKALLFICAISGISGILIPDANWLINSVSEYFGRGNISVDSLNKIMPFHNYPNMLFFFILGGFVFESRDRIKEKLSGKEYVTIFAIIFGIAGLMLIKYIDYGTWRWNNQYIENGYKHIATAVLALGLFVFFLLYNFKKSFHILAVSLGRYTLGIYYIHYITLFVCSTTIYPYLTDYYSFGLNCIKTVAVLLISTILTILIKKIPLLGNIV